MIVKFKDVPLGRYFVAKYDGYYEGFYKTDWNEPHKYEHEKKAMRSCNGMDVYMDPDTECKIN